MKLSNKTQFCLITQELIFQDVIPVITKVFICHLSTTISFLLTLFILETKNNLVKHIIKNKKSIKKQSVSKDEKKKSASKRKRNSSPQKRKRKSHPQKEKETVHPKRGKEKVSLKKKKKQSVSREKKEKSVTKRKRKKTGSLLLNGQ